MTWTLDVSPEFGGRSLAARSASRASLAIAYASSPRLGAPTRAVVKSQARSSTAAHPGLDSQPDRGTGGATGRNPQRHGNSHPDTQLGWSDGGAADLGAAA